MVQLKPRKLRHVTEVHIPALLIGYLKSRAKEIMFTGKKVDLQLSTGTLELEPLFLVNAPVVEIAERIHLFVPREDVTRLETVIKSQQALLKELISKRGEKGYPTFSESLALLQQLQDGSMSLEDIQALRETLSGEPV